MAEKKENLTLVAKLKVMNFTESSATAKTHKVLFKVTGEVSGLPEGDRAPEKPEVYAAKEIWDAKDFPDDLEGEATFEKVPKDDGKNFFFVLQKWNGKEKSGYQSKQQGARGGGGYVKSKEEIHATALSGVIKGACEMVGNLGVSDADKARELMKVPVEIYLDSIRVAGGQ